MAPGEEEPLTPELTSEEKQRILDALLRERDGLRAEILQKFQHHLQLYSVLTPTVAVVVTAAVGRVAWDILLLIPVVTTGFAFRYLWEEQVINAIGLYLKTMESQKLPKLIGFAEGRVTSEPGRPSGRYWVAWEHYFHEKPPPGIRKMAYYQLASALAFVVVPFGPAIAFSLSSLSHEWFDRPSAAYSRLPWWLHVLAVVAYSALGYYLVRQFRRIEGPPWGTDVPPSA